MKLFKTRQYWGC